MLEWPRWWRRTLVAAGAVLLLGAGVSIFGQPDREVLYQADPPLTVCTPSLCTTVYRLEVGNTGREPVERAVIRLRRAVVARAVLPVKARDYGKFERPVRVAEADGIRAYDVGRLESRVRVELSFVLSEPAPAAAVPWGEILVGVDAPGATVRAGHAGWVMVLRAWLAFLSLF
jgi:hypothetical protein